VVRILSFFIWLCCELIKNQMWQSLHYNNASTNTPHFAISWVNSTVVIMTVLIYSSKRFFPSPKCPKWLWCPCSLLINVYHNFILVCWGRGGGGCVIVLTTYHCPVPRLRIIGYISLLHLYAFRDNFIINFVYILYVSHTWSLCTYMYFT